MKFSFVIITFNEEKNIERCLDSIKEVADEIVVVDSFSSDKTAILCNNYNLIFQQTKWQGYSRSKNFANSLASNDWIFSIDADEVLSPELAKSLKEWKALPIPHTATISRLTNYCGAWIRHGGWYPDKKFRLFNRKESSWQGDIHEVLISFSAEKPRLLNGDLLHYSYYSISGHLQQIDKFTSMTAEELFARGKNASMLKLLVAPPVKFFRDYFFRLGFLDAYAGLVVAALSAYATFVKYLKLRELHAKSRY